MAFAELRRTPSGFTLRPLPPEAGTPESSRQQQREGVPHLRQLAEDIFSRQDTPRAWPYNEIERHKPNDPTCALTLEQCRLEPWRVVDTGDEGLDIGYNGLRLRIARHTVCLIPSLFFEEYLKQKLKSDVGEKYQFARAACVYCKKPIRQCGCKVA